MSIQPSVLLVLRCLLVLGPMTSCAQTVRSIPTSPEPAPPAGRPAPPTPWRPRPFAPVEPGALAAARAALFGALATEIGRAARDTTPRPWVVALADTAPGREWSALRSDLAEALRGRMPGMADSAYATLIIGRVEVHGDTVTVGVAHGWVKACRRAVSASANQLLVRTMRGPAGEWGTATVSRLLHADWQECPR